MDQESQDPIFNANLGQDENLHLKFFISILFISIKAQIFSIYLIIYHLFKHFAQAQLKSAMLIKKTQV